MFFSQYNDLLILEFESKQKQLETSVALFATLTKIFQPTLLCHSYDLLSQLEFSLSHSLFMII